LERKCGFEQNYLQDPGNEGHDVSGDIIFIFVVAGRGIVASNIPDPVGGPLDSGEEQVCPRNEESERPDEKG